MAASDSQSFENSSVPPGIVDRFLHPNLVLTILQIRKLYGYAPAASPPDFEFDIHLDQYNRPEAFSRALTASSPDFEFDIDLDQYNRPEAFSRALTASSPDFAVNTLVENSSVPPANFDPFPYSHRVKPAVLNRSNSLGYAPPPAPPEKISAADIFSDIFSPPSDFSLSIPPDVLNRLGAFGYAPPAPSPHLALNIPADVGNFALGVGLAYSFANASNGYNPGAQRAPPTSSYTSNVQTPPPDSHLLDDYKAILPVLLPVNVGSIFAIIQTWTQGNLSSYDRILICGIVCSAVAASVLCRVAHRRLHNPTTRHKWFAKAAVTFTGLDIVGWMCILLPGVAKLVVMGAATLLCFLMMFAICE